jgi:ribosomal protein S18 acetylase RimI-like enzyme
VIRIQAADLRNSAHQAALVEMLDLYAQDLMGNQKPLAEDIKQALPGRLAQTAACRAWLALDDEIPVGVLIAFLGFSTFQAKPLLNLHDVAVRPGWRGQGVGRKLLAAAEDEARRLGCCKLTLEVRGDNDVARHLYEKFGFEGGTPRYEFWSKML